MNNDELKMLANRTRFMRESGVALIIASLVLAFFLITSSISQKSREQVQGRIPAEDASNAFAELQLRAKAAIVYDLSTQRALYEMNADSQLPLASLTKLLTVYAALSVLAPDTPITITKSSISVHDSHTFNEGQILLLTDLARLTLTASLNDGAAAIATATANQESRTEVEMLAAAASALNLSQTYALNGSGLDLNAAISGGYGSARDLARLAGEIVSKAPEIALSTTMGKAQATSAGGTVFSVTNTDPIIGTIPHLLLSKTGYTDLAGGNLVLVIDVGIGHPIAIVVLGSSRDERFTDSSTLVAATLAHFAGVTSL